MGALYPRVAVAGSLAVAIALAPACSEPPASPAPPAPPPAPAVKLPQGRAEPVTVTEALSAADAFDLVATVDGAVLAWAEADGCDAALRVEALDAHGTPRWQPRSAAMHGCPGAAHVDAAGARITELVAGSMGERVGLAWVAEDGAGREVFGGFGDDGARRWASAFRLGDTVERTASRARLSMTSGDSGALRVSLRAPPEPCVVHGEGLCARYVARLLSAPGEGRGVDSREIPEPCDRMLVGSLWLDGVWYDGVCSQRPERVTQVFAIRPEISYAEAVPSLSGCEPLGLSPARGGAALWGECDGALGVRLVSPAGDRELELRDVRRSVACREGRPVLRVTDATGAGFELALGPQLSRLEGYLGPDVAPAESRAAWTGEALLVAWADARVLRVAAHECHGGELVQAHP